jgi:hypothetical protein
MSAYEFLSAAAHRDTTAPIRYRTEPHWRSGAVTVSDWRETDADIPHTDQDGALICDQHPAVWQRHARSLAEQIVNYARERRSPRYRSDMHAGSRIAAG